MFVEKSNQLENINARVGHAMLYLRDELDQALLEFLRDAKGEISLRGLCLQLFGSDMQVSPWMEWHLQSNIHCLNDHIRPFGIEIWGRTDDEGNFYYQLSDLGKVDENAIRLMEEKMRTAAILKKNRTKRSE